MNRPLKYLLITLGIALMLVAIGLKRTKIYEAEGTVTILRDDTKEIEFKTAGEATTEDLMQSVKIIKDIESSLVGREAYMQAKEVEPDGSGQ